MAISEKYLKYLNHFGKTQSVQNIVDARHQDIVALRHDVDHSIDIALEMAFWEYKAGCKSSYYTLHDAQYFNDPLLFEKCLQIQDFGHEVGLHINLLTQWYKGEIDNIADELTQLLEKFSNYGIKITGVAAHGDALCYEKQFTNYWLFEELKPNEPTQEEKNIVAEGYKAQDGTRSISYPEEINYIQRPDGKIFNYWSLRLSDFNLNYEASRLNIDNYYSDSGGGWKYTPDPMSKEFSKGRNLILMHPVHWCAPQQHINILSCARSGSKWLSQFLDTASSAMARHEFTLNHIFENQQPIAKKRTGTDFRSLIKDKKEAAELINSSRAYSENLTSDFIEANIYLEQFLDLLPQERNSHFIHLHRDPKQVVRSLWQRGWYEIPFDDRHPTVNIENWESMGQFEQICHYVADVNERLASYCDTTLSFEKMTSDATYLERFFQELNIAIYPNFAQNLMKERVNITKEWNIPAYENWSKSEKIIYNRICGPIAKTLGYKVDKNIVVKKISMGNIKQQNSKSKITQISNISNILYNHSASARHCTIYKKADELKMVFAGKRNAHMLLGGGLWNPKKDLPDDIHNYLNNTNKLAIFGGWENKSQTIFTLGLSVYTKQDNEDQNDQLRVMCLSYDKQGGLISSRQIATIDKNNSDIQIYFRPTRDAASFNLALFKQAKQTVSKFILKRFDLLKMPEHRNINLSPSTVISSIKAKENTVKHLKQQNIKDIIKRLLSTNRSITSWNCQFDIINGEIKIIPLVNFKPSYFLLGGGNWHDDIAPSQKNKERNSKDIKNWQIPSLEKQISGFVQLDSSSKDDLISLFILLYNKEGKLSLKYRVGIFSLEQKIVYFSIPHIDEIHSFNIAIHSTKGNDKFTIKDCVIINSNINQTE